MNFLPKTKRTQFLKIPLNCSKCIFFNTITNVQLKKSQLNKGYYMPTVQTLTNRYKHFITTFLFIKMALPGNQILDMYIFNKGVAPGFLFDKRISLPYSWQMVRCSAISESLIKKQNNSENE